MPKKIALANEPVDADGLGYSSHRNIKAAQMFWYAT
jgi:hypothetical protein